MGEMYKEAQALHFAIATEHRRVSGPQFIPLCNRVPHENDPIQEKEKKPPIEQPPRNLPSGSKTNMTEPSPRHDS
jgi:hypothetical protein